MSMFYSNTRPAFRFLPPIVWAFAVDAIDFVPAIVNTILNFFGGVGLALDVLVDVVQTAIIFAIFEDPSFAIVNADLVLPAPFDIFPSYSAKIVAVKLGIVR